MNIHIMDDEKFIDAFIFHYSKTHKGNTSKYFVIPNKESNKLIHVKNREVIPFKINKKSLNNIFKENTDIENVFLHNFSKNLFYLIGAIPKNIKIYWIFYGIEIFQNPLTFQLLDEESKKIYPKIYQSKRLLRFFPLGIIRTLLLFREKIRIAQLHKILSRIDYFCHWNKLDFDYLKGIFSELKADFIQFGYGSTIREENLDDNINEDYENILNKQTLKTIMVGNNSSITLNHISILKYLKRFTSESFIITCPLNYGDMDYKKILINYGENYFPINFRAIEDFIPFKIYQKEISNINVLVMNSIRTQGGGNISMALLSGKKVYMNPQNTHFQMLIKMGITVYSTEDLLKSSLDEIFSPLKAEQRKDNIILTQKFLEQTTEGYLHLP